MDEVNLHGSMKIKESNGRNKINLAPTVIQSGQTTIQNNGRNGHNEPNSFLTPRPGAGQALLKKETPNEKQTLERSSVDTDIVSKQAPGHIQHSKSTNRRPPAGPAAKPKRDPKTTAQQQQHIRYIGSLAKAPQNLPRATKKTSSVPRTQQETQPTPIPDRIHV